MYPLDVTNVGMIEVKKMKAQDEKNKRNKK